MAIPPSFANLSTAQATQYLINRSKYGDLDEQAKRSLFNFFVYHGRNWSNAVDIDQGAVKLDPDIAKAVSPWHGCGQGIAQVHFKTWSQIIHQLQYNPNLLGEINVALQPRRPESIRDGPSIPELLLDKGDNGCDTLEATLLPCKLLECTLKLYDSCNTNI